MESNAVSYISAPLWTAFERPVGFTQGGDYKPSCVAGFFLTGNRLLRVLCLSSLSHHQLTLKS
jgi:hypothetical protein